MGVCIFMSRCVRCLPPSHCISDCRHKLRFLRLLFPVPVSQSHIIFPVAVCPIYYFKEGKDVCGPMFVRACRVLPPASDFTFMFMPCSSERRYYVRFSALSDYLTHCFQAESGIDFIIYTGTRESKHTSSTRSEIDSSSNYIINAEAVSGRNVIIVDDLLTTGESLKDYARNLTSAGAIVLGAVFLGKTFSLPSRHTVFFKMFFRSLFRVR